MPQWIVFDDASVSALRDRTGTEVELAAGEPMDVALSEERDAMVLMPADAGMVSVLRIKRPAANPVQQEPVEREPVEQYGLGSAEEAAIRSAALEESPPVPATIATGFLGLTDELVADEPPAPDKPWWQFWR